MTRYGMHCRFAAVIALLVLVAIPSRAQDQGQQLDRKTLKGLKGVAVVIENLDYYAPEIGLSESTLQADVELKLRLAGIPILSSSDAQRTGGTVYVSVLPVPTTTDNSWWAACVDVQFLQPASLVRDHTIFAWTAATWSKASMVAANRSDAAEAIRNKVKDFTDRFINDYLAVNPK